MSNSYSNPYEEHEEKEAPSETPESAPNSLESESVATVPVLTSMIPTVPPSGVQSAPMVHVVKRKKIKAYWGGTAILSSVVIFLMIQVAIAIALISYILLSSSQEELIQLQTGDLKVEDFIGKVPMILIISQLVMYVGWLSIMWWVSKYRSGVQLGKKFWTAFKENFWLDTFKKVDILIGVGIAAAMVGLQFLVLQVLPKVFPGINMEGAGNTSIFASLDGAYYYIIAFGIGSVIGPICEELFFRGFLIRGLSNHFSYTNSGRNLDILEEELHKKDTGLGSMITLYRSWANKYRYVIAIILSSIVFGFIHFQGAETFGQWLTVIFTGTLGLVFAIVTVKLKRLYPAMIAHVLYNGTMFVLLMLTTQQ